MDGAHSLTPSQTGLNEEFTSSGEPDGTLNVVVVDGKTYFQALGGDSAFTEGCWGLLPGTSSDQVTNAAPVYALVDARVDPSGPTMLLSDRRIGGNLVADAHLAALAIEHGVELCSADSDFARFPECRWVNPLQS